MYDYRSDPLPQHTRWNTKPARIVLFVARHNHTGLGASLTGMLGLLVAFLIHFFAPKNVVIIIAFAAYVLLEAVLRAAAHYYGFDIKYKTSWQQKLVSISLVIILAYLVYKYL